MKSSTMRTLLLVVIAGLLGYFVGTNKINYAWKNYSPHLEITSKEPPPGVTHLDMTRFWDVLGRLQAKYYDQSVIKPDALVNGAISGMVSSLNDPFTMYLPPTDNTAFKQQIAGEIDGIGAQLTTQNKQVMIMAALDGSPAQKAGIKAGDTIVKVDNKSIYGMDLNTVVNQIRGPKGTKVTLTLLPKNANKLTDITVTRDTINIKSVFSWVKQVKDVEGINQKADTLPAHASDKVAYLRLSVFGDQTDQEWAVIVNKLSLQMQQDKSVKGVILDLRDNPGGLLTDAEYIASEFIASGIVVKEDDGHGNVLSLNVNRQGLLTTVPLVVLINGGSASASEIVSGALRDHGRAKLVGDKSFGKGTVQDAVDLGDGAGLHVTIAKWLTPNGTWVHQKGLTPDYPVSLIDKEPTHDTQLEKAIEVLVD